MHISFTANSASHSNSCKGVTEYLDKENSERERTFEHYRSQYLEGKENDFDQELLQENLFFSNDDVEGNATFLEQNEATSIIDDNLSSRAKENESKFFMLNISPSKAELDHIEKIVNIEMKNQGFGENEIAILSQSQEGQNQIDIIKNNLFHQNLREYTKDVMIDYAGNFNRTVYNNPEKLPSQKEEKLINDFAKHKTSALGLNKTDENYSKYYQEFREEKALEFGKDLSVRPMTEKDLVWIAKVEEKRVYKGNDRWVIDNRKILKSIDLIKNNGSLPADTKESKINDLHAQLNKDKATGLVVKEGMEKGGKQYHIHVVISRYDNCPNKRYKSSISPLANHKYSHVAGKQATVGFSRNNFYVKVEKTFDQKFRFDRTHGYEKFNHIKNGHKPHNKVIQNTGSKILNTLAQPIKQEFNKALGLNELSKLNINRTISKELGFSIPLSIPKSPLQVATKIVRVFAAKVFDQGMGY